MSTRTPCKSEAMAEPLKGTRRRLTSRESHRWSKEGNQERYRRGQGAGWRKRRADEESWNTVAGTGRRREAWSTTHWRPTSENARLRAWCRASPKARCKAKFQCIAATREALGHPRRWRHQRVSARLNCWEENHLQH